MDEYYEYIDGLIVKIISVFLSCRNLLYFSIKEKEKYSLFVLGLTRWFIPSPYSVNFEKQNKQKTP